jgi:hypothetical protein
MKRKKLIKNKIFQLIFMYIAIHKYDFFSLRMNEDYFFLSI